MFLLSAGDQALAVTVLSSAMIYPAILGSLLALLLCSTLQPGLNTNNPALP